ncbi:MAG TPA: hypothetical protein VHR45_18505 [Thermoanaerobaculia bacterium]|nr:hypothetical protein [Thermoanaerobaculia bacterium]
MHTHGMAAWLLLQEAVATETAPVQRLAREIERYFRQAWLRPLPFEATASVKRSETLTR